MMASPAKNKTETISLLNKVTSKSVLKCTNKNWDQWIQILDLAGAKNLNHKEIVQFLAKKYKVSPWWQQIVTSSYEVHIGRKQEGRNSKGEYATVATKTISVPQKVAWNFLLSKQGQQIWLKSFSTVKFNIKENFEIEGGIFGEIRTIKSPERIRMTWQDSDWLKPTTLQVLCLARPKNKCMMAFQHEKLKDLRLKKQMLEYWKNILNELETALKVEPNLK